MIRPSKIHISRSRHIVYFFITNRRTTNHTNLQDPTLNGAPVHTTAIILECYFWQGAKNAKMGSLNVTTTPENLSDYFYNERPHVQP
jgi:hypothetical protein